MIFNLTYNLSYTSTASTTVNYMGLFGVVKTSFTFKNAVMYNFNFTATNTSGNNCVSSCVAAQGGFGHFGLALGMVANGVNTSVIMTGNSIINSSITSTLQSTYKLIFQSDVGGLLIIELPVMITLVLTPLATIPKARPK
jgi:hypothetical protein